MGKFRKHLVNKGAVFSCTLYGKAYCCDGIVGCFILVRKIFSETNLYLEKLFVFARSTLVLKFVEFQIDHVLELATRYVEWILLKNKPRQSSFCYVGAIDVFFKPIVIVLEPWKKVAFEKIVIVNGVNGDPPFMLSVCIWAEDYFE